MTSAPHGLPTTRAAIGIARSARARRARNGSPNDRPNYFPCRISTSSSPYGPPPERSPSRTRPSSMPSCSAARLRRSPPSRPDPKHLGAQLGMTAVLLTWGQTLQHHPHVHCVVPAGGPSLDSTRWVACRPGFFLRFASSPGCSAACFCKSCKLPSRRPVGLLWRSRPSHRSRRIHPDLPRAS